VSQVILLPLQNSLSASFTLLSFFFHRKKFCSFWFMNFDLDSCVSFDLFFLESFIFSLPSFSKALSFGSSHGCLVLFFSTDIYLMLLFNSLLEALGSRLVLLPSFLLILVFLFLRFFFDGVMSCWEKEATVQSRKRK